MKPNLIVLIGILMTLLLSASVVTVAAGSGTHQSEIVQVDRGAAHRAVVDLTAPVGRLDVAALESADAPFLLAGDVEVGQRTRLEQQIAGDDVLRVGLRAVQRPGVRFHVRGPHWDLGLARDVPTDLRVHTEIADTNLDLRGTRVQSLDVATEMGRQVVHLPNGDVDAVISTQMGTVVVYVPVDANALITVRPGLRRVDAEDSFTHTNRGYILDGGGHQVALHISANVGHVMLRTY